MSTVTQVAGQREQPIVEKGRRGGKSLARQEALMGFLFIAPWVVGFLAFTLIPTLATIVFSLTNLRLETANMDWVGLQNYRTMMNDGVMWASLRVTLTYGAIALPVSIIAPIALAVLMNHRSLFGKPFFRAAFYFPYIIPFVAAIFIWASMLNPESGWVNQILEWMGVADPPDWLRSTRWVYPALVIVGIWGIGNAMLINLASLQGVPTELYDAAKIDGAGPWRSFWNVTFPMISPVIFYNLILTIVALFQYFTVPLVLYEGRGDPGGATMFYNLNLYKTFFTFNNMSYGATLAWFLFLIILVTTMILFWSQRFWVFYSGERR